MSQHKQTAPRTRAEFPHFLEIPTRWLDNDNYGHVNNVVYYAYFDTVVNQYLIKEGGLDIQDGATVGMAVETQCRFHRSFSFPEIIDAGLRVAHLGRTSVRYEIGLFARGTQQASADGYFVHVFVERVSQRPEPIPANIRRCLKRLQPV